MSQTVEMDLSGGLSKSEGHPVKVPDANGQTAIIFHNKYPFIDNLNDKQLIFLLLH
jgi:hypothetical protein